MVENGIRFLVDVKGGQKTGFFLDQKQNRAAMQPFCPGARVLDCFCHNGSFALNAAKYAASSVLGVDVSEDALEVARENARRNDLDVLFEARNCFDHLRELTDAGEKFDLVILDPPAFTKSRAAVESALRGYKEINLQGFRHLERGGLLATFSCSNHVDQALFKKIVLGAAADAGVAVQLLRELEPGVDHPVLLAHEEGRYLKGLLLRAV